jgi:preprotein translocase subunit YajC
VPLTDSNTDDEVLYYFLIALVLIIVVIFTFIRTSPEASKQQRYKNLSLRSSKIVVL